MRGHTYLHRSRHGVYYLRKVVPKAIRSLLGISEREVRLSLRTKDCRLARRVLPSRIIAMTELFDDVLAAMDQDSEARTRLYHRGLKLIQDYGEYDLEDVFQMDEIASELSHEDLKAYAFVVDYQQKQKLRKQGISPEASNATAIPASAPSVPHQTSNQSIQQQEDDEQISVAIDAFAVAKQRDANSATIEKYVSQCRLFMKIVADGKTDLMLSSLSAGDIRRYSETLNRLPKKVSPSDPRSIEDIIAASKSCMAERTKAAHARAVTMFLVWCQEQLYSIASKLERPLASVRKTPKLTIERKHFLDDELKLLFESGKYQNGEFTRDADYWVPLMGFFTGARQSELCQLYVSDIRKDTTKQFWLVDINDKGPDKSLKNESSRRKVPIHPTLEKLGFLEFVELARKNEQIRLFPAENRNKRGEFNAFSKRFNLYLGKVGISKDATLRLNFHSFRHTLQTDLIDQGFEEYIVNQLVGHSPAKSSHSIKTYSKGAGLPARRDVLLAFRCDTNLYSRQGSVLP